jgi:DNA-binding transcriptional LysR family regulator
MAQRAPSLAAAEAFLAATRHESFQAAAEEIALSPSAFSRRIQSLEAFAGAPLFDRSSGRPRLTEAGARFKQNVEPAFESIARAVADLRQQVQGRRLRVVTSHSLALSWLLPRLARLYSECGVELELTIGRSAHYLKSGEIDLAIWGGMDDAPCYPRDALEPLDAVPAVGICDPRTESTPRSIEDLARQRLLKARNAPNLWPEWLAKAGYTGVAQQYTEFETTHFAYESAASGLGIALAVPLLVDRFLREGRLTPYANFRAPVGVRYSLIYATAAIRRRADVRVFLNWLNTEIEESLRAFDRWFARVRNA